MISTLCGAELSNQQALLAAALWLSVGSRVAESQELAVLRVSERNALLPVFRKLSEFPLETSKELCMEELIRAAREVSCAQAPRPAETACRAEE